MRFKIIILFIIVVAGCKKEKNCLDYSGNEGLIIQEIDLGQCYSCLDEGGYFIKDSSAYQQLSIFTIDSIQTALGCGNSPAKPEIDFSKHALVGARTYGKGCIVSYERTIHKDTKNHTLHYEIDVHQCGDCSDQRYSMNWVLIYQTPDYDSLSTEINYY